MNNAFLNSIGLQNIDIGIVIIVLAFILLISILLNIISLLKINKFTNKYKKFMQGKNASSLEKDIMALYEDNRFIKVNVEKNQKNIEKLFEKNKKAYQKIGLVKYDAFAEMGGKLSYALALLDENNDGIVLNSVHSTSGCYSYTKNIKNGISEVDFSKEEKSAVESAIKG